MLSNGNYIKKKKKKLVGIFVGGKSSLQPCLVLLGGVKSFTVLLCDLTRCSRRHFNRWKITGLVVDTDTEQDKDESDTQRTGSRWETADIGRVVSES